MQTAYSYDGNGNLLTLQRRDDVNAPLDERTYSYYANTNRLMSANQEQTAYGDKVYSSGAVTNDGRTYSNITLQNTAHIASGIQVKLEPIQSATIKANFTIQAGGKLEIELKTPTQHADNYVYDAIGNLTKDKGEGVEDIKWSVYGKVQQVTHSDGTVVNYRYDGGGKRVEKQVVKEATTTITRYVRDASGNVMATYLSDASGEMLTEQRGCKLNCVR